MQAYLVLALLFFAGIAVFVFQNPTLVIVHFLNWTSPKVSLAVVVLIAACAGAFIIFMVDSFRYFKVAKKTRELTQANKKMQYEIKSLKGEKSSRGGKDKKSHEKSQPAQTSDAAASSAGNNTTNDVNTSDGDDQGKEG